MYNPSHHMYIHVHVHVLPPYLFFSLNIVNSREYKHITTDLQHPQQQLVHTITTPLLLDTVTVLHV